MEVFWDAYRSSPKDGKNLSLRDRSFIKRNDKQHRQPLLSVILTKSSSFELLIWALNLKRHCFWFSYAEYVLYRECMHSGSGLIMEKQYCHLHPNDLTSKPDHHLAFTIEVIDSCGDEQFNSMKEIFELFLSVWLNMHMAVPAVLVAPFLQLIVKCIFMQSGSHMHTHLQYSMQNAWVSKCTLLSVDTKKDGK